MKYSMTFSPKAFHQQTTRQEKIEPADMMGSVCGTELIS
jgi:hypothetical protein